MQVSWLGKSFLKIVSKDLVIAIDPYKQSGLGMTKFGVDILLKGKSHDDSIINGTPFVVDVPGEYEVKNVFIYGIATGGDDLVYRFEIENMSVGHLSNISSMLSKEALEKIEGVDILFLPVGGNSVINSKIAVDIVNSLEPRIVIPIYYLCDGIKEKLDSYEGFVKELGVSNVEEDEKIRIRHKDLPQDDRKVIVLKPTFC